MERVAVGERPQPDLTIPVIPEVKVVHDVYCEVGGGGELLW